MSILYFIKYKITIHNNEPLTLHLINKNLGSVWLEGWKSLKIENGGRMKKWEDRKYFNFPHFCLVGSGKVEGWKK